MRRCPECDTENPTESKFCSECGARLTPTPGGGEVRKVVTIVFADVVGSTAMGERIDPESLRTLMGRYFAVARRTLERHGGNVEKFIGDAVVAIFGVPVIHEDDALRAVRAAHELRDGVAALAGEIEREGGPRLEVRVGVNTGEIVAGGRGAGETIVTGDAVNVAARLEQSAGPGEVLLGAETLRLVRDAVVVEAVPPLTVKGKEAPLDAYRLVELRPEAPARGPRLEAPMVGRERELARLSQAFEDVVAERRCHLFTLLGAAGVGKSRLVREFERSLGPEVTVLHGRCLPYGEGITYWPLGEAVRAAAGIEAGDQREAAIGKLAALLGADEDATEVARRLGRAIGLEPGSVAQDEVLWAARRALEALARERPLVVVFDDIQWAEPAFLELVEHVADWSRDAPILLLCPGRPDLLDLRPSWGGGKLNATTVLLEPLRADAAEQLLDELTGEGTLPATLRVRIAAAAEGNPLFVEEMVAMLVDEGALGRDDGRWVLLGEVGELRVPPTIQALLAARLDRLPPDERSVAERASVIGRIFERQAVVALSPLESQPDVPASLMALVRRELLRPDRSELAGDDAFRFRHLLIRDAAYDALPKAERAGLHERFADWLLAAAGDRLAEYEEIVGYHLDQAQRHRAELGQRDAGTAALAERAARHLAAAGGRARDREDTKAAASLLRRAVDLLPADSAEARALLFELAIVQTQGVDIRDARATTRELLERSLAAGDAAMAARARLVESSVRGASDPAYRAHEAQATLQEALALFTERGDRAGLALAWDVDSEIELLAARWTRSFESARRGLEIARELRQTQTADRLMGRMVNAALWGPMPVPEALALADEMLGQVEGRARRAGILDKRALLLAMDGRADEARADRAAALALWEELHGAGVHLGFAGGLVEWTLGDVEGAVDWNGRIAHTMEALGQTGSLSTIAALLGRALLEAGRPEAEVLAEVERCRTLASPDDTVSQAGWRALLALVMIGREDPDEGQLVEADRLSTEAIEILGRADQPSWLADLLLDRATVLLRLGRAEEARAATARALALYEGKGNRPWSERARGRLAELGPG